MDKSFVEFAEKLAATLEQLAASSKDLEGISLRSVPFHEVLLKTAHHLQKRAFGDPLSILGGLSATGLGAYAGARFFGDPVRRFLNAYAPKATFEEALENLMKNDPAEFRQQLKMPALATHLKDLAGEQAMASEGQYRDILKMLGVGAAGAGTYALLNRQNQALPAATSSAPVIYKY